MMTNSNYFGSYKGSICKGITDSNTSEEDILRKVLVYHSMFPLEFVLPTASKLRLETKLDNHHLNSSGKEN